MPAFMEKDSTDKFANINKYTNLLSEPSVNNPTIIVNGIIIGSVVKFVIDSDTKITYWIDRTFLEQSIATIALKYFLEFEISRPILTRVAFDNFDFQRVLEKFGFLKISAENGFANAWQMEIEEFIYKMN